ncbi:hypothetical protein H4R18_005093 [Coemansia javaensis]|uniref:Mediator of RNA polymerase II transcription subunit 21 n=1 Tax=Coemansia javaensis TaxID=2761396 RepID=A0A9W8H330_9FUNG|nr:hypothetical protein H4R18_005093 [Coemansia javaensis]
MEAATAKAAGAVVDRQCKMLFTSLFYLHKRAGMAQVSPEIPVTQTSELADSAEQFAAQTREIAADICRQAKKIDALVESLPDAGESDEAQAAEFARLAAEDEAATAALREADAQARALLQTLNGSLRAMADSAGAA